MDNIILFVISLFCLISVNNAAELLHSGSGRVGGGNFTYYSMMYEGFVMLELISTEGDCDLFVSQYLAKPSFEPETYCLQSATCGLDSVVIPKSFKRPVGIGIFGYPGFDVSAYQLNVYQVKGYSEYEDFTDELSISPTTLKSEESAPNPRSANQPKVNDHEQESFVWVVFWSVIEFLIEIMFL